MDVIPNTYMPGDSRLVQQLVYELKSQGIFDQFRKECIADVDTKPAYQNLRQRVEGSVSAFLKEQTWSADMNKNQVREQLRKNIYESGYLDTGVERIVDQVVNPKINSIFFPQVEDVVYRYLGVEKPSKEIKKETTVITDLLPTDLEAVSPESVQSFKNEKERNDDTDIMIDSQNNSINSKADEDESPPFEPLENNPSTQPVVMHQEENSGDSQLSGFSGLQSHESSHANDINTGQNGSQMDWAFQDSQDLSQNSFDSRQSLDNSDTKMEICEDSESKSLKSSDNNSKIENGSKMYMEDSLDDHSMDNLIIDETDGNKNKEIVSETKKIDEKSKNEKKPEEKRNRDKKEDDKKKSEDKKSKNSDKYTSRDKREEKYKKDDKYRTSSKDRDRSSSKHSSSSKEKSSSSSSTSSRDKEKGKDDKDGKEKTMLSKDKNKDSKDYKTDPNAEKGKSDKDKYKSEKDKSKDKYKEKEKGKLEDKSIKEKEKLSKKDKDKSEKSKDKSSKDKERTDKYKDKTDKNKDKSEKKKKEEKYDSSKDKPKETKKSEKEKSDKDKSDRYKEKTEHKERDKTEKDKSRSSNSKSTSKDKDRDSRSISGNSSSKKETSSSKRKEKSDSSVTNSRSDGDLEAKTRKDKNEKHGSDTPSPKKSKKDSKKDPKDDHYSFKDKKNDRRSFDRDSNDGHSSKKTQNYSVSLSERTQQSYQDSSSSFSGSGSGDSRNSDAVEQPCVNHPDLTEKQEPAVVRDIQTFKYSKPKFASNFEEARKIMKIRKQLALLEKQNKLSLAQVEMVKPVENGNNEEEYKQNVNMSNSENRTLRINLFKEVMQEVTNSDKENSDSSVEKPKNTEKKVSISPKTLSEKKLVTSGTTEISKSVVESPSTLSPKKPITLQSTNLSKENWEALEARLAQEMSNLDYGSYESHYDDYDEMGYIPVVVSPRKNIVLTLAEDIKRKNSETKEGTSDTANIKTVSNLNNKKLQIEDKDEMYNKKTTIDINVKKEVEENTESYSNAEIKVQNQDMVEIEPAEETVTQQECKESDESKENIEVNIPEVVENLVNNEIVEELVGDTETPDQVPVENSVEQTEMDSQFDNDEDITLVTQMYTDNQDKKTERQEICVTLEEIQSDEFEKLQHNNEITLIEVTSPEICEGEVVMDDTNEDQLESETANFVVINTVEKMKVPVTCERNELDKPCRYLEKPDSILQQKLQYLYKYIFNLENEIQRNIKLSQNNFLPTKRGRKRKLNENDLKNNNETSFNQTVIEVKRPRGRPPKANSDVSNSSKDKSCNSTDVQPQNFSFPLSPAESEKSFEKKEEEINTVRPPKQKKSAGKTPVTKRLQRYSSEDLYKPRPLLGSRRSRSAKDS